MHNILIQIGETVRRRRELLALSQPRLAEIAGISTRTIQLVEQGKANPSLETLTRMIDPLGLTIEVTIKDLTKSKN